MKAVRGVVLSAFPGCGAGGALRALGRGAGRDDPPESPPGVPGGVGRDGIGGPVVGGGPGGAVRAPRPRSAPTARPAWWDGVSHAVTRLARLDRLRAVGPLMCRWTTWFTKYGGPTARKWSKQESAAMIPLNNLRGS